jgi:hypothetical protein
MGQDCLLHLFSCPSKNNKADARIFKDNVCEERKERQDTLDPIEQSCNSTSVPLFSLDYRLSMFSLFRYTLML